jgi:hypothetical protein
MPRLAVVFDTNIYRQLSAEAGTELAQEQAACSVIALANFWSIMELGAHLCDSEDPHRRICHRALKAIWAHCTQYDGSALSLRLAGDSDSQLALSLFNAPLPGREDQTRLYAQLVEQLATAEIGIVPEGMAQHLDSLRDHRDAVESQFTSDMQEAIRSMDPSASGWRPWADDADARRAHLKAVKSGKGLIHLAAALVVRAARSVGVELTEEAMHSRADYVLANFATPLLFYNGMIRKTIESGIDYSVGKHANSIWDMQLCFYALNDASVAGIPIALVSNEKAIHAAAREGSAADRVMTLTEFRRRLTVREF